MNEKTRDSRRHDSRTRLAAPKTTAGARLRLSGFTAVPFDCETLPRAPSTRFCLQHRCEVFSFSGSCGRISAHLTMPTPGFGNSAGFFQRDTGLHEPQNCSSECVQVFLCFASRSTFLGGEEGNVGRQEEADTIVPWMVSTTYTATTRSRSQPRSHSTVPPSLLPRSCCLAAMAEFKKTQEDQLQKRAKFRFDLAARVLLPVDVVVAVQLITCDQADFAGWSWTPSQSSRKEPRTGRDAVLHPARGSFSDLERWRCRVAPHRNNKFQPT